MTSSNLLAKYLKINFKINLNNHWTGENITFSHPIHCVKSVQIQSYFWSVFGDFSRSDGYTSSSRTVGLLLHLQCLKGELKVSLFLWQLCYFNVFTEKGKKT